MRGVFLSLCLSVLQLKQSCPTRHQMRGVFLNLYLSVLQLKQPCPTRTPDERGISEFVFTCLTIEAVVSY